MTTAVEWNQVNSYIVDRLDIESVYRELGVDIVGNKPGNNGWLSCRAAGRDDNHASAAINVGTGSTRGRYRDLGGIGESLSIFDFAAKYGHFATWQDARKDFAKRVNLAMPSGKEPKRPIDSLEFVLWQMSVIRFWCGRKDPLIRPEAVYETGARLARYPASAPTELQQSVIAFPGYGPEGIDSGIVAWVIVEDSGGMVKKFEGKNRPPKLVKDLCVGNSQPALLNKWAVERLEKAEFVWKVEGVSDMLIMHSCIPPDRKEKEVVISNAFGAQESVLPAWVNLLAGKDVCVVHDSDTAGQIGASRWVMALAGKARTVVNVTLPYEVLPSKGRDTRDLCGDWFRGDKPMLAGEESSS